MRKMLQQITIFLPLLTLMFITLVGVASAEDAAAWKFSVEPYLMATSIEGDASSGRVVGANVDVSFEDILENLQFGLMIHAEAHHQSDWGLIFDYGYMDLGADISGRLGGVTSASVQQRIVELLLAKKIHLEKGSIELFAGIRSWDNDVDITIDPAILPGTVQLSVNESWIDPVVGGRLTWPLSSDFDLVLRGDIGGFGVGAEFTVLAAGGVQYQMFQHTYTRCQVQSSLGGL